MIRIQYTAKRALSTGRAVGDVDEILSTVTRLDRRTVTNATRHTALGGNTVTRIHDSRLNLSITTGTIKGDDVGIFREFLASVAGGESFTFAENETDEAENYILEGQPTEQRQGRQDWFRFSFEIRKA